MFTGIVQAVGDIENLTPLERGVRLVVDCGGLDPSGIAPGDSVCVQGACLTVVAIAGRHLSFDVSRETLDCTAGLGRPGKVNLETSLRINDKIGGHLVTGHVDAVGEVTAFERVGESVRLEVRVPHVLSRYVARKGSITIDGVSLTVNRAEGDTFEVNLIPHTLDVTTLKRLAPGAAVNLEVDLIARYVERMLGESQAHPAPGAAY